MMLSKNAFGIFMGRGAGSSRIKETDSFAHPDIGESFPTIELALARMRLQKRGQGPSQDGPEYTIITAIQEVPIILLTSSAILGKIWPVLPWIR